MEIMYFIAAIRRIYRIINKIKHKKVRMQDFVYILMCGKKKKSPIQKFKDTCAHISFSTHIFTICILC